MNRKSSHSHGKQVISIVNAFGVRNDEESPPKYIDKELFCLPLSGKSFLMCHQITVILKLDFYLFSPRLAFV